MAEFDSLSAVSRNRKVIKIGERSIEISALTLGDIIQCRTQSLDQYRRDMIRAWTSNADLMPEDMRSAWVREAFEKAQQIEIQDLPTKSLKLPKRDAAGKLVKDSTGAVVMEVQPVEYAIWWATETYEGKLYSAWLSIRRGKGQEAMTLEQVDRMFSEPTDEALSLADVADAVGDLTQSKLGNG